MDEVINIRLLIVKTGCNNEFNTFTNVIEILEIDPHMYGALLYDKVACQIDGKCRDYLIN